MAFGLSSPTQPTQGVIMKIDGFIPIDPVLAIETGVELNYKTTVGGNVLEFNFRAKSSGSENKAFQVAAEKLSNIREVRRKTGYKQPAQDDLRETLAIWHDHAIISWTTTVKSEGKIIEATRDNFIELLSMEMFLGVFTQLATDCSDASHFTKEIEAAAVKN